MSGFAPGTKLRVIFPRHIWHGKQVTVAHDAPRWPLGPPGDSTALTGRVIFCRGPGIDEAIGLHPNHVKGLE